MTNEIKRKYYNGVHYELDEINKVVRILPEFKDVLDNKKLLGGRGWKKIGGSSVGDVLEVDKYKSTFVAFCRMANIGIPILNRRYVDAGISIEPMVVEAIESTGKKVTTYDPKEYNWDFFADKDDVVGGLPDGYIEETKTIIEIKTTGKKNLDKWEKWGIPAAYLKQAQLYAYLMGVETYSIVATFLEEEDYVDPVNYPISERKIKNWNFKISKEQAEDDIKKIKDWYREYTTSGVSPVYKEDRDAELIEWLRPRNKEEWKSLEQKWIDEGTYVK